MFNRFLSLFYGDRIYKSVMIAVVRRTVPLTILTDSTRNDVADSFGGFSEQVHSTSGASLEGGDSIG